MMHNFLCDFLVLLFFFLFYYNAAKFIYRMTFIHEYLQLYDLQTISDHKNDYYFSFITAPKILCSFQIVLNFIFINFFFLCWFIFCSCSFIALNKIFGSMLI